MTQYFAQVVNGVVDNVRVVTAQYMADNPELYQGLWVETFIDVEGKTYAGIGYTYDAEANNFIAPVIPE